MTDSGDDITERDTMEGRGMRWEGARPCGRQSVCVFVSSRTASSQSRDGGADVEALLREDAGKRKPSG